MTINTTEVLGHIIQRNHSAVNISWVVEITLIGLIMKKV